MTQAKISYHPTDWNSFPESTLVAAKTIYLHWIIWQIIHRGPGHVIPTAVNSSIPSRVSCCNDFSLVTALIEKDADRHWERYKHDSRKLFSTTSIEIPPIRAQRNGSGDATLLIDHTKPCQRPILAKLSTTLLHWYVSWWICWTLVAAGTIVMQNQWSAGWTTRNYRQRLESVLKRFRPHTTPSIYLLKRMANAGDAPSITG